MKPISLLKFNSLAAYVRDPLTFFMVDELEWFEDGNERVLGVLFRDRTDDDFGFVVMGRDRLKRFRAVETGHSFPTRKRGRKELQVALAKARNWKTSDFFQHDEVGKPIDFFRPVVPNNRLSHVFRELSFTKRHPASRLIEEMMNWYQDVDGNFVEQFQTTGTDARIWELYLYATFVELGYAMDERYYAPDFYCRRGSINFFVEATTINPSADGPIVTDLTQEEYLYNYVPIKFGSALFTKLKKEYWNLDHVKGLPFLLAIQDFHAPQSMAWTAYALPEFLYGVRQTIQVNADGTVTGIAEPLDSFNVGKKQVPAGFFHQPGTEHVSAVLANPGGTLAKFDRMAYLAGFGRNVVSITRAGLCHRRAGELEEFAVKVSSGNYEETWTEGLSVYHNPNAVIPLDPKWIPGAAHHFWTGDDVLSEMPEFHPVGSLTSFVFLTE
jgi:hypothetical protein